MQSYLNANESRRHLGGVTFLQHMEQLQHSLELAMEGFIRNWTVTRQRVMIGSRDPRNRITPAELADQWRRQRGIDDAEWHRDLVRYGLRQPMALGGPGGLPSRRRGYGNSPGEILRPGGSASNPGEIPSPSRASNPPPHKRKRDDSGAGAGAAASAVAEPKVRDGTRGARFCSTARKATHRVPDDRSACGASASSMVVIRS